MCQEIHKEGLLGRSVLLRMAAMCPCRSPTGLMCPDMLWKNWGGCAAAFSLRSKSQSQDVLAARRGPDHAKICSLLSSESPATLDAILSIFMSSGRDRKAIKPEVLDL